VGFLEQFQNWLLDLPLIGRKVRVHNWYGSIFWYKGSKLHRMDGPAIERSNGDKEWLVDGKLHRINGPAIELKKEGVNLWALNGDYFRNINEYLENNNYLTKDEKIILKLTYGK
jgi:hypothetical protein